MNLSFKEKCKYQYHKVSSTDDQKISLHLDRHTFSCNWACLYACSFAMPVNLELFDRNTILLQCGLPILVEISWNYIFWGILKDNFWGFQEAVKPGHYFLVRYIFFTEMGLKMNKIMLLSSFFVVYGKKVLLSSSKTFLLPIPCFVFSGQHTYSMHNSVSTSNFST